MTVPLQQKTPRKFISKASPSDALWIIELMAAGLMPVIISGSSGYLVEFEAPVRNPPPKLWAEQVLEITRKRRDNYGRPLINFARIARLWSSYREQDFSLADVALMMILLKVGRLQHDHSDDSYLDIMGYADCVNDILTQLGEQPALLAEFDFTPEEGLTARGPNWLNAVIEVLTDENSDLRSPPTP